MLCFDTHLDYGLGAETKAMEAKGGQNNQRPAYFRTIARSKTTTTTLGMYLKTYLGDGHKANRHV